ncbi:MAG: YfhO family protein [Chloroflexia bacterium]
MTLGLPGLLQPWGILLFAIVAAASYVSAYRWSWARPGRPDAHLDVVAVALLGVLTAGFFWRPLAESATVMPAGGGDFASFYFPTYTYAAEQIKNHTIPLWNPHLFSGMPLAADVQTAIFYPLNWILFLFVQVDYGSLEWLLIAHYWLASVFTYLFLRDVGMRRLGGLVGAVVFAFSGFMVAHFGHLPMVPVATWIPLILLCLRRAYLSGGMAGWAWAVAAGLCTTMSLLAGHVQIFAYGLMAAGLLWVLLLFSRQPVTWRTAGAWTAKGALALAIALGIGALQVLPAIELTSQSVRSAISYEEASEFPAQPVTLINMVLPRVFGSNPTNYSYGPWQTTENWAYCGVVTLALAAAGLALRRTRMLAYLAMLTALGVVLMVGDLTIVSGWVYKFVPGFSKLRDAGRALVLVSLGLAGLAGYGADAVVAAIAGPAQARASVRWWVIGVSAFVGLAAFGVMPALYKEAIVGELSEYGRLPGAINDLGIAILWLGLLAAVCWAALRGRLDRRLLSAAVLGLVVLDIFSPNSQFNPTTEDVTAGFKHFDAASLVRKGAADDATGLPRRLNSDTDVQDRWQPSTAVLLDLYDTGGAWNPLKLERYDYLWDIAKRYPDTPLYDLTGAAFEVITPTINAHAGQPKWERVYQGNNFEIYNNKNALPRAFLVHDSAVEPKAESLVLAIRRFDVNPRHTVLFESGTAVTSTLPGTAEGKATGESVHATRYTPNGVDIDVTASSPGWLVLTDAWYPGWGATVDGKSAPVLIADHAYRAVSVPAGTHRVSMQFRPASWVWGRAVSLGSLALTLAGLGTLLALGWRRRRGKKRET